MAVHSLTPAALRRMVEALDTNRNQTIEFPELDIPGHLLDRMDPLPGDHVRISDMVKSLAAGAVRIPVANVWETAERLANALDANHNGVIDAAEAVLSTDARQAVSSRDDGRVSTHDLAYAFYKGELDLSRDLTPAT